MILLFQNTLTGTSYGETILQLDKDLIKSVRPEEIRNKGEFTFHSGEGSFSELYHYIIVIELENKERIGIVFANHYDREAAISYIYNEMVSQPQINSFYKRQTSKKAKIQTDF